MSDQSFPTPGSRNTHQRIISSKLKYSASALVDEKRCVTITHAASTRLIDHIYIMSLFNQQPVANFLHIDAAETEELSKMRREAPSVSANLEW